MASEWRDRLQRIHRRKREILRLLRQGPSEPAPIDHLDMQWILALIHYHSLVLNLGDCHVIRNAGGLARESIRSIVISQRLLGTREIAVFHHVGCGMLTFSSEQLHDVVRDAQPQNTEVADAVGKVDFQEFSNFEESVKSDVRFLRENPLLLRETTITGWIYDVTTGKVKQIAEA